MNHERYGRWVLASHAVGSIEPFMVVAIQGLGKLDSKLMHQDETMLAAQPPVQENESEGVELTERLTLSYLWVLGAYEIVRALDQHFREKNISAWQQKCSQIKHRFERLRIPLAKFEAARRHQNTDSHVAFPSLHRDYGLAWQVAPGEFIARGELSQLFLNFLEEFRKA